jgi:type II restriction/modification system DNA methylase subunit YeeA
MISFTPIGCLGFKDGFDMVISNPPYIQLQNNHGELADKYNNQNYECFSRSGDIYQLFYECCYNFLKENGHLCFITSNKWMRAAYGEKTRIFFADKANPKILIDFAGQRVFESATVDVNIILLEKKQNEQKTVGCIIKEDCKNNMTDYIKLHSSTIEFLSGNSWVILSSIEKRIKEKIERVGVPLKDWDISINYGIKTGCNEAFIIDKAKRDEIIAKDQKSAEIIRPILRGRDIVRYRTNFADLYLINTHNGIPSENIPPIDINEYPAIKKHLDKYLTEITNRDDQGITSYNLRSCAYMNDFSKQKLYGVKYQTNPNSHLILMVYIIQKRLHLY